MQNYLIHQRTEIFRFCLCCIRTTKGLHPEFLRCYKNCIKTTRKVKKEDFPNENKRY